MQVGDLIQHVNHPESLGVITKTYGTPTGDRVNPPTVTVQWIILPSPNFVDTLGSVWLRRIKCN